MERRGERERERSVKRNGDVYETVRGSGRVGVYIYVCVYIYI